MENRNFQSRLWCCTYVDKIWIALGILTFVLWMLCPSHRFLCVCVWKVVSSQHNWAESTECSIYPSPYTWIGFLTSYILNHRVILVITEESTLTYYYHPKAILYIIRIPPIILDILLVLTNAKQHISASMYDTK